MKIHCIGIGGIGVSSLAQYYLEKGHKVSGSDLNASEVTDFLQKRGVAIFIGNNTENINKNVDLVIYSPAVKPGNPEFDAAKKMGIKLQSYPEALGDLTREYFTIAISGSHGKSTTTAMTALAMIKANLDPTVIVGTKLKEFSRERDPAAREGSNFRMGQSKYLVIEACEYDGSFLNYDPKIAVITNVDKEHLDYFGTFANVIKTFKNFIKKIPQDGWLVYNKDDARIPKIKNSVSYSLRQKEAKKIASIMKIPGKHNVSNALAVLAVARILGIKDAVTFKSLSEFKGSWRRFEIVKTKPYTVVSDYGHHPNEVLATLKATREKYPKKTIWCIFQPHQYQRTYYLFKDFVKVLRSVKINHIIITDIYDVAGREVAAIGGIPSEGGKKTINKVSSEMLVKKIARKSVQYMKLDQAEKFVKEQICNDELIIIMGAGDIYKIADKF